MKTLKVKWLLLEQPLKEFVRKHLINFHCSKNTGERFRRSPVFFSVQYFFIQANTLKT
jgi:hypothetical protein